MVEIITLGTPTGSSRIAGAASAVAPEPPAEMIPAMSLCAAIQRSKATVMPATAEPRSVVNTPAAPRGWKAATAFGGISAPDGLPEVDRSAICTASTLCLQDVTDETQFRALGIHRSGCQHTAQTVRGAGA